ncbi:MAG: long-chain fatty acid--CoA ligase [SAR324 cluster bacterium]|uniref:Long-chain fatty acid--CoA ligase n=1 Tax=SAR324 cluster bacterium TaxID=2024889 RepID=A0A2A4T5S2_9DELT|nr:MAG: long-chain fatty acid--CoA ligase [SAR324 cluster bacterium]
MADNDQLLSYTIPQLLRWRVQQTPDKVALRRKEFGYWKSFTWQEYYTRVRQVAIMLKSYGIGKDDKLALIGDNIPEMLFVELAAQSLGAISVGIYQTSMPHEIESILNHTDVVAVFCENQEQVDKLVEVRENLPQVKTVIYEDSRGMRNYRKDDWFVHIEDIYKEGEKLLRSESDQLEKIIDQGKPTDVNHFCLTSGTTGKPKATMLTHLNFINMGLRITEADPLEPTDEYMSFLPFAWIGEQMTSLGIAMARGITVNFPESVETAMDDLKEIGPHMMFGAPRIWETIRSQIWLKIDESYKLNKMVYNYFMKVGEEAALLRMGGKEIPLGLSIKAWLGKNILFRPLVNQLGLMRLRRAYTGGAALGPELFTFYQSIGVNLKQIYGQTEIIGVAYMHRDGDVRHDTVGLPLPGTECTISEKGEILSKSLSVCAGYYKNKEATDELLEGGWLHSGDAGYIEEKTGHLIIIDRLSDVMHSKKGDMFSPMFLENKLKFSPYIKEAVIYGNQEDYVSSMINIDPVTVGKWAEDHGISYTTYMDLSQKEEVAEMIFKEIRKVNDNLETKSHQIKRFVLLYKLLDADDEELTKTGKIRRKFVQERYQDVVDALYDGAVHEKEVQAIFTYQDGQTTTVDTKVSIHTMEEVA